MTIKTIDSVYSSEFKKQNSKFIAYLYPFESINLLNEIVGKLRKEHPKANHICYAYRCGYANELIRANDDGEPNGTAGKPILNQLYSYEAKNCILLVVRYFGGTKLGVSGLIEAYKSASVDVLNRAKWVEREETIQKELHLSMESYYKVIEWLKQHQFTIDDTEFSGEQVTLKLQIPLSKLDELDNQLDL